MELINPPYDKIVVIIADRPTRKILHSWLRNQTPKIYSGGIRLDNYPYEVRVFKQCYICNYNNVPINDYHYGQMPNNIDEYRTGICPECTTLIFHDCNYDDGARYVKSRNAIAIGNYFKGWDRKFSDPIPFDETVQSIVSDSINEKKVFMIDVPSGCLNRKQLGKYIYFNLK